MRADAPNPTISGLAGMSEVGVDAIRFHRCKGFHIADVAALVSLVVGASSRGRNQRNRTIRSPMPSSAVVLDTALAHTKKRRTCVRRFAIRRTRIGGRRSANPLGVTRS